MAKVLRTLVSLTIPIVLVACGGGTEERGTASVPSPSQSATARFTSAAAGGLSFEYPATWSEEPPGADLIVVALAAPASDAVDGERPNVNVVVEPLGTTMGVDDYFEAATATSEDVFENYEVSDEGSTTLGDLPARWVVYEATIGDRRLQQRQVITVHGSDGVVVTLTASPDGFAAAVPQGELIVSSFRFEDETG